MHDYSRDIMLANAQTEMEAGLAKMELNKITRDNISTIMANQSINLCNKHCRSYELVSPSWKKP